MHPGLPPTYELVDLDGEPITGIFYTEELTLAAAPTDQPEESENLETEESGDLETDSRTTEAQE